MSHYCPQYSTAQSTCLSIWFTKVTVQPNMLSCIHKQHHDIFTGFFLSFSFFHRSSLYIYFHPWAIYHLWNGNCSTIEEYYSALILSFGIFFRMWPRIVVSSRHFVVRIMSRYFVAFYDWPKPLFAFIPFVGNKQRLPGCLFLTYCRHHLNIEWIL